MHQTFCYAGSWLKPLPEGLGEVSAANKSSLKHGHTCGTVTVCVCVCILKCLYLCVCVFVYVSLTDSQSD